MKNPFKSLVTLSAVAAGIALFAANTASAQILVQWGSDNNIVTTSTNLNLNSIGMSLSTTRNPGANVNGYYDGTLSPAGRSAIYYGTVYNTTDGNSRLQVSNLNPDAIRFDGSNGTDTSAGRTFAGAILWQKSNGFLTAGTFGWNQITDITWTSNVNAASARGETRFIVRNGSGNFYISNNLGVFTSASAGTATKANVSGWFNYDPATSIIGIGSAVTPTLNDITAIGYYFGKVNDFTTIAHNTTLFSVTVIPEPSAALLIGLGALVLIAARRRRAA